MRILITGGAGFIGSHMAENFSNKGWEVVVLDNFTTGKRENLSHITQNLKIVEGDIRDTSIVNEAMEGCDAVIHLAALASVPASFKNPVETYEVNFMGTQNVLEAALQHKVKRVTFASSSAVYGDTEILPITEENPDNPLSPYGLSKLLGEKLCRFYNTAFGLPVVIFRFFNVYGPRQNPFSEYSAVIPKFLSIIKDGGTPTIFGDGEQTRDFIYISDLVHAHERAIGDTETEGYADERGLNRETQRKNLDPLCENPSNLRVSASPQNPLCENPSNLRVSASPQNPLCENPSNLRVSASPLNLASGEKTSLNDLIKIISGQLGREVKPRYDPPRSGDILHSYCEISKIYDVLTFKPAITMEKGIEKMLKYYNLAN